MTTEKSKTFGKKDLDKRLGALTVGEFLHVWRVSEEMSLKHFGKLIGMTVPNLCDIEKGRKGVSPEKAKHIAQALGVPEALLIRLSLEESLRSVGLKYRVSLEPAA